MPSDEVRALIARAVELGERHSSEVVALIEEVDEVQPNDMMLIMGSYMGKLQEGFKPNGEGR